jgi:hypothetical protein
MRAKKPASHSILSLRRPGRNSLSCTTPFFRPRVSAALATAIALSSDLKPASRNTRTCMPQSPERANRRASVKEYGVIRVGERGREVGRPTLKTVIARERRHFPPRCTRPEWDRAVPVRQTPPCLRIARIERTRCWVSPMRPVTPCVMTPSRSAANARSSLVDRNRPMRRRLLVAGGNDVRDSAPSRAACRRSPPVD